MIQPHIRSLRTQPGSWGAHPQPPLADAIPHFDMPSHNSAAKPGAGAGGGGGKGGGGFPDEEEARGEGEQIKCGGGSEETGEWWSMLTQFVSGG